MEESDKCPAFLEECPFKDTKTEDVNKCPAFDDGCPFKGVKDQKDLQEKLKEMPEGHFEKFSVWKHIHESTKLAEELFGECTHFKKGCPFKSICPDGSPLVVELERLILHRRGEITPEIEEAVKLSKELKLGTKEAHTRAESTHFVTEFIKGNVSADLYALYLGNLYFIYDALEKRSEECKDHEIFKCIYFPELNRTNAIARDLNFYLGYEWKKKIRMLKAAQNYVNCIKRASPEALIAHHYTRYLGDLSGGQVLKKKAIRHYSLPADGSGVQFYEFEQIENPVKFKNMYRKKLDEVALSAEVSKLVVQEANVSFDFNTDLFLELDVELGLKPKTIKKKQIPEGECPFGFVAAGKKSKKQAVNLNLYLVAGAFFVIFYAMWRFS